MTTQHALIVEDSYFHTEDTDLEDAYITVSGDLIKLWTPKHEACITFTRDEWEAVARFVAEQLPHEAMRRPPFRAMFERAQPVYFDPAVWEPDWSKIDEKYNYIAKDHNGVTWGYTHKPIKLDHFKAWQVADYAECDCLDRLIPESVPWDESLFERPGEYGMSAEDEEHLGL